MGIKPHAQSLHSAVFCFPLAGGKCGMFLFKHARFGYPCKRLRSHPGASRARRSAKRYSDTAGQNTALWAVSRMNHLLT